MSTVESKARQLNQKQLDILNMLYRFRFGTTDLIAMGLRVKDRSTIQSRLVILVNQNLIARKYDGTYRLRGKSASYFLLPKGLKALRELTDRTDITDGAIKNAYKDKKVSDDFIDHCLRVFAICCQLVESYKKELIFFSKSDMTEYDYFPRPLPDGFISLGNKDYFLELPEASTPFFVLARKIKRYIDYAENDEWDGAFPTVWVICQTPAIRTRLQKVIAKKLEDTELNLDFTVTIKSDKLLLGLLS